MTFSRAVRAGLLFIALLPAGLRPARATTYYVRTDGRSQCNGLFDTPWSGIPGQTDCAWQQITSCNPVLAPGDECIVGSGRWYVHDVVNNVLNQIRPANPAYPSGGTGPGQEIAYRCPSLSCLLDGSGLCDPGFEALDLRNVNWIVVDGFTFHDTPTQAWGYDPNRPGSPSQRILLTRVKTTDNDPLQYIDSCQAVITGSGGVSNTLQNFEVDFPPSVDEPGPPIVSTRRSSVAIANEVGHPEFGTRLINGIIRGGWNGLSIKSCNNCMIDGVTFSGHENHVIELLNGGGSPSAVIRNLTIRNSIVMASSAFRERTPQILANVLGGDYLDGLSLLNNAFLGGLAPQNVSNCKDSLRGTVVIRNNIFYGADKNDAIGKAQLVLSDCNTTVPPVTYDIDYNAYFGAGQVNQGRFGQTPLWADERNLLIPLNYYADYDSDGTLGCLFPCPVPNLGLMAWKAAGFDSHSLVRVNSDYRPLSAANYTAPLWGDTSPFSGAMVDCAFTSTLGTFDTQDPWADSLKVGDWLYYRVLDLRVQVTAISPSSPVGCTGGAKTVHFSPLFPIGTPPAHGRWFFSYGPYQSSSTGFEPQAGSPVIDAGDPALCAHPVARLACDIGPVEASNEPRFTVLSGNQISWTTAGGLSWHLYRGDLNLLVSSGTYTQDPALVSGAAQFCFLQSATHADPFIPATGVAAFYLVTTDDGVTEGPLGTDSAGSQRPSANPCRLIPNALAPSPRSLTASTTHR